MSDDRRTVLLALDPELLDRWDEFWPAVGHASRRASVVAALEIVLAQHQAHVQRAAEQAREPHRWTHQRQTADTSVDAASRPITFRLMDGF